MSRETEELMADLEGLRIEVARLNNHRFIKIHNSTLRLVWFQLLRGLAFGFGSVAGATVVVSIAGYFLSHIDFVPILGDWASALAEEIMSNTQRVETGQ
ncbi:hypothetical protein AQS8620_03219 [Aquimixticola soesokkakensis]|uniref:Uncharacterized protein n=1 Tax=Aquimixticola soesokkakensis TaxID=1519096 RepID=A0A1Y5TNU7_9RHOB|nr:DUF5665 domain-containing protein [Aquimixticola soesokkakensis]SLN68357.1 hypothetical protein AQS8620_03219 [Aquimixticola soesokkakensis]